MPSPPLLATLKPKRYSYSTLTITFHPRAPASRIAQARHPRFLLLTRAFQPRCAHSARTSTSMSEPNWRLRDSRNICAAAEKLPLRWPTGEPEGDDATRSSAGDCGASARLVMQSTTSTPLVAPPALPSVGSRRNSDSVVRGFCRSSEMWMTVKL